MKLLSWYGLSLSLALLCLTGDRLDAEESKQLVLDDASIRYKSAKTDEVPDFQKHVVPLLGKLGCNSRSCHGSFQGQGGLRLSLFGYDFKMDHDNLTKGEDPRVDLADPTYSLMLEKAVLNHPHKGGKRMEEGGWEYNTFLRWIQDGAKPIKKPHTLVKLKVTPAEVVFDRTGQKVNLKAVAIWDDGTQEDVTPLCRFEVKNDQISDIDNQGQLIAKEAGDTHAIVYYDNAIIPVPLMRPVSDLVGSRYPAVPTPTQIDKLVVNKLSKMGIVPSDLCTDAEFLRRLSLDLTGTLPTSSEVKAFLEDSSPKKREKKVEELLKSPAYTAWWTTRLCDYTGNSEFQLRNLTADRTGPSKGWYNWIAKRVEENRPYDEIVKGIVLATSRQADENFNQYCKAMSDIHRRDSTYADREFMPYYWARRNMRQPEEKALGFAYSFLGIRIQCAQCHKHPFDKWTQDDYKEFTKFFTTITFGTNPTDRDAYANMQKNLGLKDLRGNDLRRKLPDLLKEGKTVPYQELYVRPIRKVKVNPKAKSRNKFLNTTGTAKLLGEEVIDITKYDDPREPLMNWLSDKKNPYFAKAFVNRVWSNYFHSGIVDPPDDMNMANPAINAELLDYLAEGFIKSGFDMKWVHREIVNSRTYQLSWKPNETNKLDDRNFSRAVPRRLPAEAAYDALVFATSSDQTVAELRKDPSKRAVGMTTSVRPGSNARGVSYAMTVFGRSTRETNCDCDRTSEPSLLQTVYLRNDADLQQLISNTRTSWLSELMREVSPGKAKAKRAKRPDNFAQVIKSMQRKIEKLRKGKQFDEAKKLQAKLNSYRNKFLPPAPKSAKQSNLSDQELTRIIEEAYLRTLSRKPSNSELDRSRKHLSSAEDLQEGLGDLVWALVNTKEFIINH